MATFHRNGGNFGLEWLATFKRNGGSFAPDYASKGKFLLIEKNKMIVETYRDSNWPKAIPDVVITTTFDESPDGSTAVELFMVNVQDEYVEKERSETKAFGNVWKEYFK